MENLAEHYNSSFYKSHNQGMSESAKVILGLLHEKFKPQSIVDVGCGQGAWLAAAESLGIEKLKGFDGDWVNQHALLSNRIDFEAANFTKAIPTHNERYELCISLEVAEHLPKENAEKFVEFLCSLSDVVLFSAAIKHQGGTNHVNEQWQSYWVALFQSKGYDCVDIIRGETWNNPSVEVWYKQNTFLFIRSDSQLKALDESNVKNKIVDVVHPLSYERKVKSREQLLSQIRNPSLNFIVGCIKRYIKIKLGIAR
ncbi:class I SAM-dependent methyltransferase [Alteromonas sp. ASW11-130]|uniref:class I SAM-dependent methyltransferase n=1 Tax=Alteromonas sp. ASW11-130 TaxID=3015775 RepID=UPI00224265FB|nr:class I SAM-dependent methyltransferase [Alteromonas sp. ASW11-130]MCW8091220.1 class I SAM-dependent methyltransferase [Alteromonas sp. ASW11-130]